MLTLSIKRRKFPLNVVASIKGELIRGSKLIYVLAPQTDVILHYRIRECVLEVGG